MPRPVRQRGQMHRRGRRGAVCVRRWVRTRPPLPLFCPPSPFLCVKRCRVWDGCTPPDPAGIFSEGSEVIMLYINIIIEGSLTILTIRD